MSRELRALGAPSIHDGAGRRQRKRRAPMSSESSDASDEGVVAATDAPPRTPLAVRAVELSLFLSMLPLHADHPDKLMGFALIAGQILDELAPRRGG